MLSQTMQYDVESLTVKWEAAKRNHEALVAANATRDEIEAAVEKRWRAGEQVVNALKSAFLSANRIPDAAMTAPPRST